MKQKCRKMTAAFLSCILVFLSVTAELAHCHDSSDAKMQPQNSQPLKGATQSTPGQHLFCAACAFALTHVATAVALQPLIAPPVSLTGLLPSFTSHRTALILPAGLRAPPALFA